jgi:thiol-disulfide isomerase/thioredoxin
MVEECKICNVCNVEKPISDFYFRKEQNKYRPNCKKCKPLRSKEMIMAQAIADKRICKHCNIEKPSSEYQKAGGGKFFQPYCKPCDAERKKKYEIKNSDNLKLKRKKHYEENKVEIARRNKEYIVLNKEKVSIRNKAYRERTKKEIAIKGKIYREQNKDILIEKSKNYYYKNKDIVSQKNKEYRNRPEVKEKRKITNKLYKEKNKEKFKKYREDNKLKIREYSRIRCNKKSKTDISFRILKNLRSRIRFALKKGQIKKADTTENLLGCTVPEFKAYFTSLFTKDMSWSCFMAGKIHIDHIIPCAKFDLTNEEQQRMCFHYTNLQPLWSIDNLRKGTKIITNTKINV